jgi:hypothetical protein
MKKKRKKEKKKKCKMEDGMKEEGKRKNKIIQI